MCIRDRSETIGDNTRALFHSTILVVVFIAVLFSAVLLLFLAVPLYNRRRLERIAYVDPVTGGHNKRRFEQIAAGYLRERKTPYVLIYSNIDRFKPVSYTHLDVYKRQELTRCSQNAIIKQIFSWDCDWRFEASAGERRDGGWKSGIKLLKKRSAVLLRLIL